MLLSATSINAADNEEGIGSVTKVEFDDDVDALFKLPLTEFIDARNNLAARLKRGGRASDGNLVKALGKPSISAWAVNQLYWKHREAVDRLLVTSQRLRQAQTSQAPERIADMRGSLEARREVLSRLSDLAVALLRDAGHTPTPDTIRRITTTLEAISTYAMLPDGPTPGRLTQDVEPPGFESLASLIPVTESADVSDELKRATPSRKSRSAETKTPQRASPPGDAQKVRQREETHRARIAAAKVSLKEAEKSLAAARSRAQRLEAAQTKAYAEATEADAEARQAEKLLREAEVRFKKADAASRDAAHRTQRTAAEAEEAAQAVEAAKHGIEKASKELESLLQESAAR
jgi:hypothetical protein